MRTSPRSAAYWDYDQFLGKQAIHISQDFEGRTRMRSFARNLGVLGHSVTSLAFDHAEE